LVSLRARPRALRVFR